jgi:23S rRNA (uridine2552-2'-O)-methyltransferase
MGKRVLHDEFFRKAKAEGYLARSAYKLTDIDDRHKLLKRGDAVLDVGCSPGSWLQVASQRVGEKGVVVGIDLKEVDIEIAPNVFTVQGDVTTIDLNELLGEGGKKFNVVLSDMAPNTSGHGDDLRSAELCRMLLALVPSLLRPGGNLTMKVLEGAEYTPLLKETKAVFRAAKGFKPAASRDVSREMYIVAHGYKGAE